MASQQNFDKRKLEEPSNILPSKKPKYGLTFEQQKARRVTPGSSGQHKLRIVQREKKDVS